MTPSAILDHAGQGCRRFADDSNSGALRSVLRLAGDPEAVLTALRTAGSLDLGHRLSFLIEPDPEMPTIKNEGMIYDGLRFRGEAQLAGKLYGELFQTEPSYLR